nr:MAG: ORF1 [Torque teno midi virus]
MPFYWRRRRKPWFGRWRQRRYRKYKARGRFRRRRRPRPAPRRRRRRRRKYKVRRKRKTIPIRQWQPDSIVKCKIKGLGILCAGAEGNQFRCYTNQREDYTQPRAPGGGGFGVEQFSLSYLYSQWLAHRNIWTKSNEYRDLCRFSGAKFTFYRHTTTDFVISYDNQPPFTFNKFTYPQIHPQNLLLAKRHRVLLSTKNNPKGKNHLTLRIKPPKTMTTRWFFQEEFAPHTLLRIQAAAANFPYSLYGPNSQSPNLTLYCLNIRFYQKQDWGQNTTDPGYLPYTGYPTATGLTFHYRASGRDQQYKLIPTNYKMTVNYDTGFFSPKVLQSTKVTMGETPQEYHNKPITLCRYNPEEDTGVGNKVWLTSIITDGKWMPPSDNDLIMAEEPLYIAFFGFYDYIIKAKKTKEYMTTHMFVVKSKAIKLITPHEQDIFPFVDLSFIQGNMPYGEQLTLQQKNLWFPTAEKQLQTINGFVESGYYTPKYFNLPSSTWQLTYKYCFYFKWGGQQITDQIVQNPKDQGHYPMPNTVLQTVQISDPMHQAYKAMFRAWDYRRGILTKTALKRMYQNLPIDSIVQSDESETPKKKKKTTAELQIQPPETEEIQACLLSLCEENTCQNPEDLQQLIHHQQQQQEHLKLNIIKLLIDLKKQQRYLQMQTGFN